MSAGTEERVVAGRYRLRRVVGHGGMGVLWAAEDRTLGREVAVKEVRPPAGLSDAQRIPARERALREARAAARITHPCAVTVYDVVEEEGRPWIVMELLSPRTLADVLAEEGPLAPSDAARLGLDLLDALAAAHAAGVLHRDVKPANVLFAEGRAVLADFGIATLDDDPTGTAGGMLLGSPAFMAPERARGEHPTPASDLWSLGATLFTAVEGESPFRRDGHLPTLAAVVTQDAPPAEHAGPLRHAIEALLARDPDARPDADQARALLRRAAALGAGAWPVPAGAAGTAGEIEAGRPDADDTVEAVMPAPVPAFPPVPGQRSRRHRALAAAVLAPVAVFVLVTGLPMPWQHSAGQQVPAAQAQSVTGRRMTLTTTRTAHMTRTGRTRTATPTQPRRTSAPGRQEGAAGRTSTAPQSRESSEVDVVQASPSPDPAAPAHGKGHGKDHGDTGKNDRNGRSDGNGQGNDGGRGDDGNGNGGGHANGNDQSVTL